VQHVTLNFMCNRGTPLPCARRLKNAVIKTMMAVAARNDRPH
jgi:hypothetical protein